VALDGEVEVDVEGPAAAQGLRCARVMARNKRKKGRAKPVWRKDIAFLLRFLIWTTFASFSCC